jgi:hypothetical protein
MSCVSIAAQIERYPGGMTGGKPRRYAPPVIEHCASPSCYNFFRVRPNRKKYCSRDCQRHVAKYKMNLAGAKAYGDKVRGKNKDRHIQVSIEGKSQLLHRVIYAEYLGRPLKPYPEEIVHHKYLDKHHNCVPGKILCGSLLCTGNLELLSGDAAAKHIEEHRDELYAARWGGRATEAYTFRDDDGEPTPF